MPSTYSAWSATWEADKSEMTPMRDLGKKMVTSKGKTDAWATGRYLAAILSVWAEELRRSGRAAKKAS